MKEKPTQNMLRRFKNHRLHLKDRNYVIEIRPEQKNASMSKTMAKISQNSKPRLWREAWPSQNDKNVGLGELSELSMS
jgi:hypothetical protein